MLQERMGLVVRIKQELAMLLGPTRPRHSMSDMTQRARPAVPAWPTWPAWPATSPDDDGKDKIKKFLSSSAVEILTEWYGQHQDHPYPEEETVRELARRAQISPAQVKKWMANKRVRTSNTLAHNGSIHPKKLQKLIQIHGKMMGEPSPQGPPGSNKRSKRALNPQAVESMNRWYFSHIHYPYPTDEEKMKLAQEGNITVAQVTCWFANKRNRSNNSRKLPPTPLTPEEKLNICQGLKKMQVVTSPIFEDLPGGPNSVQRGIDDIMRLTPSSSHTSSNSELSPTLDRSEEDEDRMIDESHDSRPIMQSLDSPPLPPSH